LEAEVNVVSEEGTVRCGRGQRTQLAKIAAFKVLTLVLVSVEKKTSSYPGLYLVPVAKE
jgi:hypothetical protein